ncbi:MAG TPA: EamA family transporter [Verrucomicrobiae bacterium]|nr:EamA family transporter [Verrucomicrobiae bacterium]
MSAETLETTPNAPPRANAAPTQATSLLLVSFAAVYILWGSTFFAIRMGIESFPPLVLAGLRHISVGLVFYPVFRRVGGERPTLKQWRTAIVTGVLLLLCGNGTVSWAENVIPSGIAALLVATVTLWMVLVDWLRPGGLRPAPRVLASLVLGFAGMALLVGPKHLGGTERVDPLGALALVLASLAWAIGSIYSKHHPIPKSAMLGVAMQMVAGGTALLLVAAISGEYRELHLAQVTLRSWLALGYLAVFGSALGFSAYVYILKRGTAAHVATYAFVNPVVALFLGWLLGGEALTLRTILASAVILTAVILVITMPHKDPMEADEAIPAPGEA